MEEESVTRTVEHLIGQALVASYSQTRVHITRYADLSTCVELETRLLAIADAQSKTTDLIISIVREGDNSYAGALVKRGALAERRERDQRFLASAVAAAEKAKADVLWARIAMEAERADVAAWCKAVPLNERAVRAAKEGRCWDCFAKTSHTDGELPMCKECFASWGTSD